MQTNVDRKPSYFCLEKVGELIDRYKSSQALLAFIDTKKIIMKAVATAKLPSLEQLGNVKKLLEYFEQAIRDTLEDEQFVPNEGFELEQVTVTDKHGQPVIDEKGNVQTRGEFTFKLSPEPKKQPERIPNPRLLAYKENIAEVLGWFEDPIRAGLEAQGYNPNDGFRLGQQVKVLDKHGQPVIDEDGNVLMRGEFYFKIPKPEKE